MCLIPQKFLHAICPCKIGFKKCNSKAVLFIIGTECFIRKPLSWKTIVFHFFIYHVTTYDQRGNLSSTEWKSPYIELIINMLYILQWESWHIKRIYSLMKKFKTQIFLSNEKSIEIVSSRHNGTDAQMNLQRLFQNTQHVHRFKLHVALVLRDQVHTDSHLLQRRYVWFRPARKGKSVFSNGEPLGIIKSSV